MVPYEYYLLYKHLSYRPEYHALMLMHCGLYIFNEGCEVDHETRGVGEEVRHCHSLRPYPLWSARNCLTPTQVMISLRYLCQCFFPDFSSCHE